VDHDSGSLEVWLRRRDGEVVRLKTGDNEALREVEGVGEGDSDLEAECVSDIERALECDRLALKLAVGLVGVGGGERVTVTVSSEVPLSERLRQRESDTLALRDAERDGD
jgi:hypothetical protein